MYNPIFVNISWATASKQTSDKNAKNKINVYQKFVSDGVDFKKYALPLIDKVVLSIHQWQGILCDSGRM